MTYDPAQVSASIIIDGIDVRQSFGFESLEIAGRTAMQMERREHRLPFLHGRRSQGGTYRPRTIGVRGWMPKANLYSFSQFLFRDVTTPGRTEKRRTITFQDNNSVIYSFDSVETFVERQRTKRWMITDYVDVEFTIVVNETFARRAGVSHHGVQGPLVFSGVAQGATSTNPGFLQIQPPYRASPSRTHEDLVVKLGKSTTPKLISCRTGPITKFNAGLKMTDNEGTEISGAMYAPTELLTNPDFETDATTGWTSFGGHTLFAPWGAIWGSDGVTHRIPTGSVLAHGITNATNSGLYQDFATTSGKQYTVRVEVFCQHNSGGTVRFGKAGTDEGLVVATIAGATRVNSWQFIEFTMESLSTENYRVKLNFPTSGTSYYVNKISVVESKVLNGSFEGTFSGGVAPNWQVSNFTGAEETTTVHSTGVSTARKAQKITRSGANGYLRPSADITIQDDRVYYLCGWVYRESGTGDLTINNDVVNAQVACGDQIKLETGKWIRFTTFFDTFDNKSSDDSDALRPSFAISAASTVLILDDVALHELSSTTDIHFEPGPFGKRLQVPVGRVAAFEDNTGANNIFMNSFNFTFAMHFLPGTITDYGAPMIARMTRRYGQDSFVRYDDDRVGASISNDGNNGVRQFQKLDGDQEVDSDGLVDWQGGTRGTRGIVFKYDGNETLETGFAAKVFFERCVLTAASDTSSATLKQAITPESDTIAPGYYPALNSYRILLLGDAGHWDSFWSYQHSMSDEDCAAECVAQYPPKFDNKVFTYNANILINEELIIDLSRGTVEKNDGTGTLTNAFADVEGSIPELSGEAPVLMINDDANGIQILGKGTV